MRGTIDELIEERAPWLRRGGAGIWLARRLLYGILHYERTVQIGEALQPMPGADALQSLADMIALHVDVTGSREHPQVRPADGGQQSPHRHRRRDRALRRARPASPGSLHLRQCRRAAGNAATGQRDRARRMAPGETHPQAEPRDHGLRPCRLRGRAHGGALPLGASGQAPLAVAARTPLDAVRRDAGPPLQPAGRAAAHHRAQFRACSTSSTASIPRCATSRSSTRC